MYLKEQAIDNVLGAVGKFAAGSEMVLTYSQPSEAEVAKSIDSYPLRTADCQYWLAFRELLRARGVGD
jgi:hypothetical protein